MRGSTTPSKSTSSQGTHAHGLLLTFRPLFPLSKVNPPFVTVPRELTFGPPPNEADGVKSSWYANAAYRSISKEGVRFVIRTRRIRCSESDNEPVVFGLLVTFYPVVALRTANRFAFDCSLFPGFGRLAF
jgi:hypothetical protein